MKNLFYLAVAIVLCQACQYQSLQPTYGWQTEKAPNGAFAEEPMNTENYAPIVENQFLSPQDQPLSTFSIDVDYASYSNTRRFIKSGSLPPADAVRIEELVNYFSYDYPAPDPGQPFSVHTELSPCPWQPKNQLLHIGLKAKEVPMEEVPASNLVFLLDVSGSMSSPDKLPLLINSFQLLTNQLRAEDRVAIVVYAGASGVVLPSTPGNQKDRS
ncbi:MAG: von Willebrand factor type A domain-containing protein [Bacteroidota bacterium]